VGHDLFREVETKRYWLGGKINHVGNMNKAQVKGVSKRRKVGLLAEKKCGG